MVDAHIIYVDIKGVSLGWSWLVAPYGQGLILQANRNQVVLSEDDTLDPVSLREVQIQAGLPLVVSWVVKQANWPQVICNC